MDVSIFLAKFWGWYLLIFFLILSLNPKRIKQIFDDLEDEKFLIITSFIAIIIGLLNILSHNIWEPNWTIIITLIDGNHYSLGYSSLFFQNKQFLG